MTEKRELLRNLKGLIETDRDFGVEFLRRSVPPAAAPEAKRQPASAERRTPNAEPLRASSGSTAKPKAESRKPKAESPIPPVPPPMPIAAPTGLPAADLTAIAAEIAACRKCKLCEGRTNTVPGEGNPATELLFVGEGPGADEDAQGRPFVGRAGELLTKMIEAMGFKRDEVFIANIVKCRPPNNRPPAPEEIAACLPYLRRQVAALRPKVICSLGNTPLRALTGDDQLGITRMRGQQLDAGGIPLIPTFHPAYLLRNPPAKKPCWEDLRVVLKVLGRTPPARKATEG
jgi:DNA polymerase